MKSTHFIILVLITFVFISCNSKTAEEYVFEGIKKSKGNDLKGALKMFDKAIEIKPDYSDAYLGRGSVKFSLNDISGACNDWEIANKLGNTQATLLIEKYCNKKSGL